MHHWKNAFCFGRSFRRVGKWLKARGLGKKWNAASKDVKTNFKILVAFSQCMGQLPNILTIRYPEGLLSFLRTFDLDFMNMISLGCLTEDANFHTRLMATCLFPIALIASLSVVGVLLARSLPRRYGVAHKTSQAVLWIAYFSYAPASTVVFLT